MAQDNGTASDAQVGYVELITSSLQTQSRLPAVITSSSTLVHITEEQVRGIIISFIHNLKVIDMFVFRF